MSVEYEDMVGLPHPVSARRARMTEADRAAQFSPFAALTGYEEAVEETARLTMPRIELGEDARAELDEALRHLASRIGEGPRVAITHFVPDERKQGGSYVVTEGIARRISSQEGYLTLSDGGWILFGNILSIQEME